MSNSNLTQPQLIVLVGLPGAGKTTYAKGLSKAGKIVSYCDDYEFGPLKRINPSLTSDDKRLLAGLNKGETWAVGDTRYCDRKERVKLDRALKEIIPNLNLKFIYFENRPDLCEENARMREGALPRHQINLIYYYTQLYEIPKASEIIKIYAK